MGDKHSKKTILITGTNHGLGLSLTKLFLKHDYEVFAGVYKLKDDSEINAIKDNEKLHIIDMDVTDTKSIEKAAEYVSGITDKLDIVINNAGILCPDSYVRRSNTIFDKMDVDSMMDAYNVNALGALRVANIFSNLLIKSDEKLLINISSDAASINTNASDWHGYRMSKAALNMAGALIQNDFVEHGGRVWQIHPGWMQTYMHGRHSPEAHHSSDFAAEHIYKLILNADAQKKDELVFIDILGQPLPW